MGLVVCPECKKDVSQYSESCPACGFPIKQFMKENGLFDTSKILLCPKCGEQNGGFENTNSPIHIKCKYCGIPVVQTDVTWDEFYDKYGYRNEIEFTNKYGNNRFSQDAFDCRIATIAEEKRNSIKQQSDINIPHCPTCSSTNIHKISTAKKATKIGLFGIFGTGDIGKTWKCNNCGSKF